MLWDLERFSCMAESMCAFDRERVSSFLWILRGVHDLQKVARVLMWNPLMKCNSVFHSLLSSGRFLKYCLVSRSAGLKFVVPADECLGDDDTCQLRTQCIHSAQNWGCKRPSSTVPPRSGLHQSLGSTVKL